MFSLDRRRRAAVAFVDVSAVPCAAGLAVQTFGGGASERREQNEVGMKTTAQMVHALARGIR